MALDAAMTANATKKRVKKAASLLNIGCSSRFVASTQELTEPTKVVDLLDSLIHQCIASFEAAH